MTYKHLEVLMSVGYGVFSLDENLKPVKLLGIMPSEQAARDYGKQACPNGFGVRRYSDGALDIGGGYGRIFDGEKWI